MKISYLTKVFHDTKGEDNKWYNGLWNSNGDFETENKF